MDAWDEADTPQARAPIADDKAFVELLAAGDVFVLPGSVVELPGYFRVSLTASDAMVERSIPAFAAAMTAAREHAHPVGSQSFV